MINYALETAERDPENSGDAAQTDLRYIRFLLKQGHIQDPSLLMLLESQEIRNREVQLTPSAKRLLRSAQERMHFLGDDMITSEGLLLACFDVPLLRTFLDSREISQVHVLERAEDRRRRGIGPLYADNEPYF